jgi:DNA polymerase epsilon subunit 1
MDELADRFEDIRAQDTVDERFGYYRYEDGPEQLGWLLGMHSVRVCMCVRAFPRHAHRVRGMQTLVRDEEWSGGRAAVDFYFLAEDGSRFKVTLPYEPYLILAIKVRCPRVRACSSRECIPHDRVPRTTRSKRWSSTCASGLRV